MLEWLIAIGVFAVVCIIANDWYGRRNSRPLSHMKPKPGTVKQFGFMEDQGRTLHRDTETSKKDQRHDR